MVQGYNRNIRGMTASKNGMSDLKSRRWTPVLSNHPVQKQGQSEQLSVSHFDDSWYFFVYALYLYGYVGAHSALSTLFCHIMLTLVSICAWSITPRTVGDAVNSFYFVIYLSYLGGYVGAQTALLSFCCQIVVSFANGSPGYGTNIFFFFVYLSYLQGYIGAQTASFSLCCHIGVLLQSLYLYKKRLDWNV